VKSWLTGDFEHVGDGDVRNIVLIAISKDAGEIAHSLVASVLHIAPIHPYIYIYIYIYTYQP